MARMHADQEWLTEAEACMHVREREGVVVALKATLTATTVCSGYAVGGTEQMNTKDSAYGSFQGTWYISSASTPDSR